MYLLRKILARCLFPVSLVLEIALAGLLLLAFKRTRTVGKVLVALSLVLLYAFSLPPVGNRVLLSLERRYAQLEELPDGFGPLVIAVPGNGLDQERGFNNCFIIRLREAGRIARMAAGRDVKVLVSVATDQVDAEFKKRELDCFFRDFGIAADRIILIEGAMNSKAEVRAFAAVSDRLVVVSDAFHLPRLMLLAERSGVEAAAAPAGYLASADQSLSWIPSADSLNLLRTAVYEYLGILAERMSSDER